MIGGRVRSFRDAFRGLAFVVGTQRNAWIHALATVVVVALGFALDVGASDWRWLVSAIGMVWVAEAMNTALERIADAVSSEHHPLLGRAKDAGAAAVLLAAITAAAIGVLVFAPHAIERLAPATTGDHEPCAERAELRNPYFGDLHVHTTYSQDASTQGVRGRPRDAYRFARGEPLGIPPYDSGGEPLRTIRLARPLDFAAVTDHAELLGETAICRTPGLPGHDSWTCRLYRRFPRLAFFWMNYRSTESDPERFGFCGPGGRHCLDAARGPWADTQSAAEGAYDRTSACDFTSFVAYEWTGARDTNNLHRNVIFRNEHVPSLPASFYETPRAEALWASLDASCNGAGTGCEALVIPHNSNLSNGLMFESVDDRGEPMTAAEARLRARFERLVEIMQHKGDSECSLDGSPADELCGFEKLTFQNFLGQFVPILADAPNPSSFVRPALANGVRLEESLGVNPFKLGVIASTDTHLAAPGAVSERGYPGHGGAGAPPSGAQGAALPDGVEFNPGGLAGVWAEENTRDALFDAMKRRETFGTSGSRIAPRFFGGWSFSADLCQSEVFVETGYASGVPMGGDLPPRPTGASAPVFALWVLRDPGTADAPGVPLARAQIVKGWVEAGATREAVYDVAGDPSSSADVDLATCRPRGPGADSLCAVWRDPDFDPDERAFYYARVVENPTCRWSTRVCNAHGVDCTGDVPDGFAACCDPDLEKTIRERAWTSPVWYAPEGVP